MCEESTTPDLANRWRESADAHARRDFDAMISFFAPDAVWDSSSAGIGAYFEGATAIRSFLEEWIASFEDYEYKQEESRDLGNGVSFAVATFGGRPASSSGGRMQEQRSYTVTWTDGLIARVVGRADVDEARADAERAAEERR
jgi:ketosteroid isomerase-like protein